MSHVIRGREEKVTAFWSTNCWSFILASNTTDSMPFGGTDESFSIGSSMGRCFVFFIGSPNLLLDKGHLVVGHPSAAFIRHWQLLKFVD